ncbi:MAG: hypothetical protein J5738_03505 [Lachnospiraceae bacterium]|nr:hypothetical protein [Lachnospiraceae bacterium]
MKKVFNFCNMLSKQIRDSIYIAITVIGAISTVMSIIGLSINNWTHSVWIGILLVLGVGVIVFLIAYLLIGYIFKNEVRLTIRGTAVSIAVGNIFTTPGLKVIGCDSHFDIRVDDNIIAKKSLHGQLVENHANVKELRRVIKKEAEKLNIQSDEQGQYTFPLGTIIPYESSVDKEKYLLLSSMELNNQYEAHTNMVKYEQMLMRMWGEISRVYSLNDVVLPLIGAGIPRFDDGPKDKGSLLKCMLCTLNNSGVSLKASVKIVLYGDALDYKLYEYKDMFREANRRMN